METAAVEDYKKLGFTKMDTAEMVHHMNVLIANYHVFYQKLRNFHWNVKGPDFFDLHEKFEELYTQAVTDIDEVAERVRVFGKTPLSTLREYLEISEIKEVGTNLSPLEMTREVIKDIESLDSFMVNVVEAAQKSGDVASVDLINKMVRSIEKQHWMLTSWMRNQ